MAAYGPQKNNLENIKNQHIKNKLHKSYFIINLTA
jgi:hypothetical protein